MRSVLHDTGKERAFRHLTEDEKQMADTVRGYLEEHPAAADTLESIAEWWILRQAFALRSDGSKKF